MLILSNVETWCPFSGISLNGQFYGENRSIKTVSETYSRYFCCNFYCLSRPDTHIKVFERILSDFNGGRCPPSPLGFFALRASEWSKKRGYLYANSPSIRIATCNGARVTSQCCPILQAGSIGNINKVARLTR